MDSEHGISENDRDGNTRDSEPVNAVDAATWASTIWPPAWTVRHVVETGSTNADLLSAAEQGSAGHRSVLATDHQTAGRGRLDRRWDAPPGANLLTSIMFDHPSAGALPLMPLVGLAAIDAIEAAAGRDLSTRLGLKWPNDVLLDGRKLAGVLAQRSLATGAIVVGIGLNVGWAPDDASGLHRDLELAITPAGLLRRLIESIDRMLGSADPGALITHRYRDRLLTLGQSVRVELPATRTVHGLAVDVDSEGRLVVDTDTGRQVFDVGDVVHLRRT